MGQSIEFENPNTFGYYKEEQVFHKIENWKVNTLFQTGTPIYYVNSPLFLPNLVKDPDITLRPPYPPCLTTFFMTVFGIKLKLKKQHIKFTPQFLAEKIRRSQYHNKPLPTQSAKGRGVRGG